MFNKIIATSAFKPYKRGRVEPEEPDDRSERSPCAGSQANIGHTTPVAIRSIGKNARLREQSQPKHVTIKCGSALVARIRRRALISAIPELGSFRTSHTFKVLIVATEGLADSNLIKSKSLTCFVALCESMYIKPTQSLGTFTVSDLRGAVVLAASLRANGVMVLAQALLREKLRDQCLLLSYNESPSSRSIGCGKPNADSIEEISIL